MICEIKTYLKRVLFSVGRYWIIKPKYFHNEYDIVFLFQKYDISGASRVHLDIVSLLVESNKLVVFVEYSPNKGLLSEYKLYSDVFIIRNKILRRFYLGMLAAFISKQRPEFFFGMGTPSFYIVSRAINNPEVKIIDIIHAVSGLAFTPINIIPSLYKRIVIDPFTKEELFNYYQENGFSTEHITLINNKTYLPAPPDKSYNTNLSILYVGRSTVEKQVHLIAEIAKGLKNKIDVIITMIGEFNSEFIKDNEHLINFVPEIHDIKILRNYYESHDLLILVSSREGFPMVIMEAMAHGVVPISTPVGGIAFHITNEFNGLLLNGNDDFQIVEDAVVKILELYNDRHLMKKMSLNAYNYAKENFSINRFDESYKAIFTTNH